MITLDNPDTAILKQLGARLANARLGRNLTQAALAREAGVSRNTVERLERGISVDLKLLLRILRALGLQDTLLAVLPTEEPSPMMLLESQGRRRQRARGVDPATLNPDSPKP